MEWFLIGVAAVVTGGKAVLDQANAAIIHSHLAARDAGFAEADETWLGFAAHAQHESGAVHALKPIPILPEPGVAVGTRFGQDCEGCATIGSDRQQAFLLPGHRLLTA